MQALLQNELRLLLQLELTNVDCDLRSGSLGGICYAGHAVPAALCLVQAARSLEGAVHQSKLQGFDLSSLRET
jgi:hypothetical protein